MMKVVKMVVLVVLLLILLKTLKITIQKTTKIISIMMKTRKIVKFSTSLVIHANKITT